MSATCRRQTELSLQLGPFTAGDPETKLLRTRHAVLVPSEYAGLILAHGEGMTPRAFFDEVYPLVQTDGNEVACLALTNFVRWPWHSVRAKMRAPTT